MTRNKGEKRQRTEFLSYDQFTEKHAQKFAGLSDAEKRSRYRDYKGQGGGAKTMRENAPAKPVAIRQARRNRQFLTENQSERIARKLLLQNEFYQALVNPFNSEPAKVPALAGFETSEFQVQWTVDVYSNAYGGAFIAFRPALQTCYAVTNHVDNIASNTSALLDNQAVFNAGSVPGDYPFAAPWTIGSWSVTEWRDVPDVAKTLELYTDYIVTAAGFEFKYSAIALQASGDTYSALLPGSYGAPYMENNTFSLRPQIGSVLPYFRHIEILGSEGLETAGITPTNLEKLNHAAVERVAPRLGFTQVWHPSSLAAITEWRPTRYMPPVSSRLALESIADTFPDGAGNTYWVFPPSCSGDPNTFRAFHNERVLLNPFVETQNAAAPASVFDTMLYGTEGAGSPAANASAIANEMTSIYRTFQSSMMGDGDNTLISVMTGLPASVLVGTCTFTMNCTALVESRTFRPATGTMTAGGRMQTVLPLAAVNTRSRAVYPPSDHADFKPSIGQRITSGVKTAGSFISQLAKGAQEVGSVISEAMPVVEEIGSALLAAFAI